MSARADSAAVERELKAHEAEARKSLRSALNEVAEAVQVQAWTDAMSMTANPTGAMVSTLRRKVIVSKARASVRVAFEQEGAPYAAWVSYGLAPRPWRERATSRSGKFLSYRLGRAKVHKPWGIQARGYAQATRAAALPMFEEGVRAGLDAAAEKFNGERP